jgi:uncharacterized protein involved in exopolysaccharide biosynthesis
MNSSQNRNTNTNARLPDKNDQINLVDLIQNYIQSFKYVLLGGLLFAIGGGVYTFSQPEIYRAEALVSPINNSDGATPGGFSNQFSGLASLIGISNQSSSNVEVNAAIIQSGNFLKGFIEKNDLMPLIFFDQWDQENKAWRDKIKPPISMAITKLQNSIKVEKQFSLRLIVVQWTDPQQAASWANELIRHLNDYIRQQKINESKRSIKFLEQELGKTTLVNNENMLFGLIEEQTKNIVLASARDEYAFKFIDPAIPPKNKISPLNTQNIILSGLFGFIISSLFVFFRSYLSNFRRDFF